MFSTPSSLSSSSSSPLSSSSPMSSLSSMFSSWLRRVGWFHFCCGLFVVIFLLSTTIPHLFKRFYLGTMEPSFAIIMATPANCTATEDLAAPFPFWSRGFARSCCSVYPTKFAKHRGGFFEAGDPSDFTYFTRNKIISGDVVYVVTSDLPDFIERFVLLPNTTKITLVTGCEDIGAPWEIFHPNRTNYFDYTMKALWPSGQKLSMRDFILDSRLKKWYAQNYDLVGCNLFSCSDIDGNKNYNTNNGMKDEDKLVVQKVFPLPIGLDLHTLGEKNRKLDTPELVRASTCLQRADLRAALAKGRPFQQRKPSIYAQFDCSFEVVKSRHMRILTRGEICSLLIHHHHHIQQQQQVALRHNRTVDTMSSTTISSSSSAPGSFTMNHTSIIYDTPNREMIGQTRAVPKLFSRESKLRFWSQLSDVQFALSPAGFGTDTHRFWEILAMHTVPVVLTSPLDTLYAQFPVVIVANWREVFAKGAVERFQRQVVKRFGSEPFADQEVLEKLTAEYWIKQVRGFA